MATALLSDSHISAMNLDLTEEEERTLAALLRQTLDYARYPLAPRLDPLKSILAKLDPPTPKPPTPKPPPLKSLTPDMAPRIGRGRRR